jgi:hypothetical protein
VLADRIAVGCTLNRGEYNLAWNEVMLPDSDDTVSYILHHIFIIKHVIFRHELFYAVELYNKSLSI